MGSSLNKDQNVQVFLTLSKRAYYAGQNVEGVVHINCIKERPYRFLNILIQGNQEVCWTEHHNNTSTTFTNSKDTYIAEFGLAKFDLGIQRGHFNFPFSILLPKAFPASMRLDAFNYIRYQISAHIPAYDENSSPQIYRRSLHIREPPRGIIANFKKQEICEFECCGCCCVCGTAQLSLQADVNHIQYGKIFHLRGRIDNSRGSLNIKNYKVVLREAVKKISSWEFSHMDYDDILLHDSMKAIPKGQADSFQIQTKLPPQFTGYTAIGNIIYRVYYLVLIAEVGCCISNPSLAIHTVVTTSLLPELQAEQQKEPPVGWSPITAVPLAFVNIKPYIYVPSNLIDERNQEGKVANGQMLMELPYKEQQTVHIIR